MQIKSSGNVVSIYLDALTGWEQWVLLTSDNHHDSPFCERKIEQKIFDEALQKNALIFMGGDVFDAMQGKRDPRASYAELQKEFKNPNYFDRILDFNASFYGKYAKNIAVIGYGNHETAVLKHYNTDLIQRLVYKMNRENGGNIAAGGYGGWVRFMFTMDKTKRTHVNMKYFHGAGGDAPVTKGVIQTARQAVYLPDADIVWNGHNHNEYALPIPRERLSAQGQTYQDAQWHVRTPGFKNGYQDGSTGFEVESGMPPKPIGAVWLRMYRDGDRIRVTAIQDVR